MRVNSNLMNTSLVALISFILGGGGGHLLDYVPADLYWHDRNVSLTVASLQKELEIPTAPDVSDAIADLGAADPHVRDAAADKLIQLGPVVLRQVQEAESSPAAEIAQRAHALAGQLTILGQKTKVRRLMAIRTMGELKDSAAVPILRPLTDSKERFVAEYARNAIAEIQAKANAPAGPATTHPAASTAPAATSVTDDDATQPAGTTQPAAGEDVWLLPAACRAVAAVMPRRHGPIDFKAAAAQLPVRSNQNPKMVIEQMAKLAISVAEKIGDVRIDSMTAGLSDNVGVNQGFVVLIARGEFDSQAAVSLAHSGRVPSRTVDGVEVFQPDGETGFFITSDNRVVLLASPAGENYPLAEMIAAVRNGKGGIQAVPEMARKIESIDRTQPIWAAVMVADSYRVLAPLQGMESLTLIGEKTADGLHFIARGEAKDPEAARSSGNQVMALALAATAEMKLMEPIVPAIKAAGDFFATVKCSPDGKQVTGTADIKDSPATLYMLPLVLTFGEQHEVIPPPARP